MVNKYRKRFAISLVITDVQIKARELFSLTNWQENFLLKLTTCKGRGKQKFINCWKESESGGHLWRNSQGGA